MKQSTSSTSVFVAAHVIKFGIPLGLLVAASRLIYFYFFSDRGIDLEVVGSSIASLFLSMILAAVLALVRKEVVRG